MRGLKCISTKPRASDCKRHTFGAFRSPHEHNHEVLGITVYGLGLGVSAPQVQSVV